MRFNRILSTILVVLFVCFFGVFVSRSRLRYPEIDLTAIKRQLREEIKDELRAELLLEMGDVITREVQKEVHLYLAQIHKQKADTEKYSHLQPSASYDDALARNSLTQQEERETIREAIQRTVRDVVQEYNAQLSDEELAATVASGGLDPAVTLPGSLSKTVQDDPVLLAAAEASAGSQKQTSSSQPVPVNSKDATAGSNSGKVDSIERTLVQKGSILLPKGRLQFEPSLTYAHSSSNRLYIDGFSILPVLVVGDISTEKVQRDVFINTWTFKYGLRHNLQTEVRVPVRFEYDRITNTDSTTFDQTDNKGGLGDIQVSVSRQIGWEHGLIPDLVANLSVKSNTGDEPYNTDIALGTGHWAVSGALVAAKASDPAVIFGSLNYTYNIPRSDIENYGKIDPGDSIGYSLGTAIALSYQTAINFSFDHSITDKMVRNGQKVPGSFLNAANFKTGFNWALNERASVDCSLSFGLTQDSPDFTFELRFPYNF